MNANVSGPASVNGMATTAPVDAVELSHPTLRQLAGAPSVASLEAARTAVLVIDFQNEYFDGGRMPIPDGLPALRQARRIVRFAERRGMPVFHVQHVLPAAAPLFAAGSTGAAFHPELQPREGDVVIAKDTVSVFAGASAAVLDAALRKAGIDTLIITGLQTHACVAGAARDAAPRGYRVLVVADACASRPLDLAGGRHITHEALHAASLAQIEDAFGAVLSTDALLVLPAAGD